MPAPTGADAALLVAGLALIIGAATVDLGGLPDTALLCLPFAATICLLLTVLRPGATSDTAVGHSSPARLCGASWFSRQGQVR